MKYLILFINLTLISFSSFGQKIEGWEKLADVKFKEVYFEEADQNFLQPVFGKKLLQLNHTEIQLTGFAMPFEIEGEENMVILSMNPYSSCFFCGGAGPETVAEIHFKEKPPKFEADQVITIKGILSLNDSDIDHLNYIFKDARLIEKP